MRPSPIAAVAGSADFPPAAVGSTAVARPSSAPENQTPDQLRRDLHATVAEKLERSEQRYTSRRRAFVELLAEAGRPVSIADIARLGPDLPRSSAYRNLVDLEAAGVVRRVAANDEFARYELAEDLTEHHHHLVCVSCGAVPDVSPPAGLERPSCPALPTWRRDQGFDVQPHRARTCRAAAEHPFILQLGPGRLILNSIYTVPCP